MIGKQASATGLQRKGESAYGAIVQGLWALLLLSVPITSFPPIADRLGNNPVSPLAILPLVLLGVLWLIPRILRGIRVPLLSGPLLLFIAAVLVSSTMALALPLAPYRAQSVPAREARALVTLALGLAFFACGMLLPRDDREVSRSLQWLYRGAMIMLSWSTAQAWFVLDSHPGMPLRFNAIHRWFSIRDLVGDRVTGLAYEPSWFADQLVVLYFPLWAASILGNHTVFPRIARRVPVEMLLGGWGLVMFAMTRSRVSFISFAVILSIVLLGGVWGWSGGLVCKLSVGRLAHSILSRTLLRIVLETVVLAAIIGVLLGAARVFSRVDPRARQLFSLPERLRGIHALYPGEEVFHVADRLAFAERVVYWAAGYRVFDRYPLMGVGLGNSGFLFEESLPGYAYSLTEIRVLLEPGDVHFPNPKNLWVRLLAECGSVGFATFAVWLIVIAAAASVLWETRPGLTRVIGLAGLLGLVSIMVEGFSLDSFALPQMWILLGLVSNMAWRHLEGVPRRHGRRQPIVAPLRSCRSA